MALAKGPTVYLMTFPEEGQNFQTAIDNAHQWSVDNKDSVTILSSIHTTVFDEDYYKETKRFRYVRAVAIRYTKK